MSTPSSTFVKEYVERLKETLGTSEPAVISRLLGITYQAAKNYLEGRLPSADVLITIAEKTDYSLNWLLTGKGAKKIAIEAKGNQPALPHEFELIIRRMVQDELAGGKKGAPVIKVSPKKEKKRA